MGVDIDYYLSAQAMARLVASNCPVLFWSFSPITVAGIDGDCTFSCESPRSGDIPVGGTRFSFAVGGGGDWSHCCYDYGSPGEFRTCRASVRGGALWRGIAWCLGIYRLCVVKVVVLRPFEQHPHRALIIFIPQSQTHQCRYFDSEIIETPFTRLKCGVPHKPTWNSLIHQDPVTDELIISIGRDNESAHVEIPKADFDKLMGAISVQSLSSRYTTLASYNAENTALLTQYYASRRGDEGRPPVVLKPALVAREVPVHYPVADIEGLKVNWRTISGPLTHCPAAVPDLNDKSTMLQALYFRVAQPMNHTTPKQSYRRYACQFVNLVAPSDLVRQVRKFPLERVVEELDKPRQKALFSQIAAELDIPHEARIESFVKNEPTMKHGRS